MGFDEHPNTIARDEMHDLISSEKVDGTAVYNPPERGLEPFTISWWASGTAA